ncbi:hypothetical protein SAMN04488056_10659 [Cohaesibacter marisflavi]|uniref:Uncharacterized protein n=1 Tax=Cohaesibacter marisflavi TaxID=655353 RepID=A0A1I5H6R3_9HYPH|nr:hypothetical protein [Cohaesibacter marisflavi]SFO43907.1 hypothetical protein SAMN04488056_10659 [Cohaesibacter marisflavi]
MKLTAIALPIMIAFTVYQPAQARDYSHDSSRFYRIYGSGQVVTHHNDRPQVRKAHKPKVTKKVIRNKTVERKVIRNANGKKTIVKKTTVNRKVIKKKVVHAPKIHKTYSRYDLTQIAQRNGYRDISDYSLRGNVASMKARDRLGRPYLLEISARTGNFIKQARLAAERPHHNWSNDRHYSGRYSHSYGSTHARPSNDVNYSFILRLNSFLDQGQAYWAF